MADFESLANAVIDCNVGRVLELTQKAVDEGAKPADIINMGLIAGMNVVGQRFKKGDMYVPEVLMAAKAMNDGMSIVKPLLVEGDVPVAGKVVLGTVAGDLHDIGKNLVGMMMESGGLEVVDVGVDISPEKFVAAIKEHKPDVLGLSALLTTTMLVMKDTIEVLVEEGLRDKVKIIVGGAPVTQDFADEIGADGWAPDAASAKDLAQELAGK
jgi:5-methyltetrahydrofolate--homocysteine methyltransferase